MKKMKVLLLVYCSMLLFLHCEDEMSNFKSTEEPDILPETGVYIKENYVNQSDILPYRIMFPHDYDGIKDYPILFFLHGAGERGNDNSSQLIHGSSLFRNSLDQYPGIVVFPQCAQGDFWANTVRNGVMLDGYPRYIFQELNPSNPSMKLLELLLDDLTNMRTVNKSRIYIAGLSMGGMGTAQLLAKRPDFFAAGVVIAGAAPLDYSRELSQTPTWIFHGSQDNVVSALHSVEYFSAIDDGSGKHRFTQYEGVGHLSWNNAFAEPDFLSWIFSKRK